MRAAVIRLGEILSHVEGTNRYERRGGRGGVRGLTKDGHFDEQHAGKSKHHLFLVHSSLRAVADVRVCNLIPKRYISWTSYTGWPTFIGACLERLSALFGSFLLCCVSC